ncbi:hypothetical protein CBE01nite_16610 [Clostridium beijerinckii]|uniref:Glycosyltransferase n=2 Tax=Clostridium beijerinckii TaxID=1520 RepID=A0AB74VEL4_CLOBE|nr:glycosyltransferase [Clostridium beijerinckii]NRZ29283.1 glycosyltransferase involved in cell wall biosynthesis [Clostridium beijerinckii]NYB94947.1 glycosyltransferase involved in cell wall biosynthesis [Clostridium beijerinckii]OOM25731.1 UDP-Glc:alpha-D-GlcNAc-diphosphoundecaprenol beta-1,3-glucosyltransferase WfgD [Clostridium beijerinckii]QUN34923.1 glycosyltransferase [Clostridium beijerinckii]SQB00095.1 glycosyltransferase [Clostridium beijerinckii]
MEIDKPSVSILLAVYKPNETWLIEQLISLNDQTYKNLELLIYDDCPNFPVSEEYFKKHITNFRYKLMRGRKNQGSNIAFEELTKMACGDFLAYCDQDDIWEKNKIEFLVRVITKEKSVMVYSDVSVIDKDSKLIAKTLKEVRPRLKYVHGEKLFSTLFFNNCIAGCCMLVKSELAKKAMPFSKVTIHDHWIAIIASFYGSVAFFNKPLVKYRIHGNNQTGILSNVFSKEDYYNVRLIPLRQRMDEIRECIKDVDLKDIIKFYKARIDKNIFKILRYRHLSKKEAYFEILMIFIPNWLFKNIIKKLK